MTDKLAAALHGGRSDLCQMLPREETVLLEAPLYGVGRTLEPHAVAWIQGTFSDVLTEIRRAVRKHGILQTPLSADMSDADKLVIVVEEIGEIARAMTYDEGDRQNLKDELTQAATMLLAWRASLS